MNYLAHFLLSGTDTGTIVGNFAADQLGLQATRDLPSVLQRGVALHRQIDVFTDNHNEVKACIALARPLLGKYAPVGVDILFDLMLFENWSACTQEPFQNFEQRIYDALLEWDDVLPEKVKLRTRKMVAERWLPTYGTREGIEDVFKRIAKRAQFENRLPEGASLLDKNHAAISAHFTSFWPDLNAHCANFLANSPR